LDEVKREADERGVKTDCAADRRGYQAPEERPPENECDSARHLLTGAFPAFRLLAIPLCGRRTSRRENEWRLRSPHIITPFTIELRPGLSGVWQVTTPTAFSGRQLREARLFQRWEQDKELHVRADWHGDGDRERSVGSAIDAGGR
jgi:hypothetical protein